MTDTRKLPETHLLLALQITCAGAAIASLPAGMIHPIWLATFIVPSALFLGLGAKRLRQLVPSWLRLTLAAAVQGLAAFIAYKYLCVDAPLDEKSSLACSLLPALTYFTLRREPSDTSLSLFLSFCFLLIGIMLNKNSADWTLLVFLVSCPWAMQIEASNRSLLQRHAARSRTRGLATRILRRAQVIVTLTLVALVTYVAVGLVPSPAEERQERDRRRNTSQRHVGLNNRFDLSGALGSPLSLSADKVLEVRTPYGQATPSNLYLRMTHFDRPGIGEWKTWAFTPNRRSVPNGRYFFCKDAGRRSPQKQLIIKRLVPAPDGELYLPPGTIGIQGVPRLEYNNTVGHYRAVSPVDSYRVSYQQMRRYASRSAAMRHTELMNRLDDLPRSLRSQDIVDLAHELAGPQPESLMPMQLAQRISQGLQARCKYTLRDPEGPYEDALHNFLFGRRTGYCMHFASALATMLRVHKVPCRIGVGLHGGVPNPNGSRTFGSQHAHAWVEIPLVNFEWVVVDPTPAADRTRRGWPEPNPATAPAASGSTPGFSSNTCFIDGLTPLLEDPLAVLRDPMRYPGLFLCLLGIFAFATLSLVAVVMRGARSQRQVSSVHKPTPDAVRARQLLDNILTALARQGYPKHHRATLEQFGSVLQHREADVDLQALQQAFDSYQEVRFGRKTLRGERHDRLLAGLDTARALSS